jgi:hypothetical protein
MGSFRVLAIFKAHGALQIVVLDECSVKDIFKIIRQKASDGFEPSDAFVHV